MESTLYILCCCVLFCSCNKRVENKNESSKVKPVTAKYSCSNPEVADKLWYSAGKKAPLFKGLEGLHSPITTKSKETQRYFDQGLMLSFGFNHAEAARSFFETTREEVKSAMSWWGFAYVLGPNYNGGINHCLKIKLNQNCGFLD